MSQQLADDLLRVARVLHDESLHDEADTCTRASVAMRKLLAALEHARKETRGANDEHPRLS